MDVYASSVEFLFSLPGFAKIRAGRMALCKFSLNTHCESHSAPAKAPVEVSGLLSGSASWAKALLGQSR